MTLRMFVPAAAALLLFAGAAHAQDAADSAGTHDNALSLGFGNGSAIGLWHRFSPRLQLGLEVAADRNTTQIPGSGSDPERQTTLSIQPAVKLYGANLGPLRPYGYAALRAQWATHDFNGDANHFTTHGFGGGVGIGIDWFPVERVSIGGHAGVNALWSRDRMSSTGFPDTKVSHTDFGTFDSGLRVQLFF